jgi:microcin C transport system permease protein
MGGYILKRLLLMIPTLFGIMLISFAIIQFAPGGPVERVLAQLQGTDVGATARIGGGSGGGEVGGGQAAGAGAAAEGGFKYRGAQGLDPEFIAKLEKQFGFDKPPLERFGLMMWNYIRFDFGESYFRDIDGDRPDHRKAAGFDLARALDHADVLRHLDSARHQAKAVATARASMCGPRAVIIVAYAIPAFLFAILLIVLFAGGSFSTGSRCAG